MGLKLYKKTVFCPRPYHSLFMKNKGRSDIPIVIFLHHGQILAHRFASGGEPLPHWGGELAG